MVIARNVAFVESKVFKDKEDKTTMSSKEYVELFLDEEATPVQEVLVEEKEVETEDEEVVSEGVEEPVDIERAEE